MTMELNADARAKLKLRLKREAKKLGVNLIGFANVKRWEQYQYTEPDFYPQTIWPWAKTVIVLGEQIYLPMLETTPSVVYSELYNTTNRMLDENAYRMANLLNELGFRAHFFPRDCYGDISVLVKKPEAAFSHVIAGYYAGLGTIGMNHTLLTEEYGPRVRLVSVITDAALTPDRIRKEDLCIHCQQCVKNCPVSAFSLQEGHQDSSASPCTRLRTACMDKHKCALYHQELKSEFRYPCGRCTAVCPIGKDKKRYGKKAVSEEGIEHIRKFGALNAVM